MRNMIGTKLQRLVRQQNYKGLFTNKVPETEKITTRSRWSRSQMPRGKVKGSWILWLGVRMWNDHKLVRTPSCSNVSGVDRHVVQGANNCPLVAN